MLCFTMGYRKCPRHNCQLLLVRPGSPSNTWFLGPSRVHNPNGISIGTAASVALTVVSNRQTMMLQAACKLYAMVHPSICLSHHSPAAAAGLLLSGTRYRMLPSAQWQMHHIHIYMQTLDNVHNSPAQGLNLRRRSTALGSTCGQCHADS